MTWKAFCDDVEESIRQSKARGYHPHRFEADWRRDGSAKMIEAYVTSGETQTGFKRMITIGLVQIWSVEALVVKHADQFSKVAVECARWRLETLAHALGH